MTESLDLRAVGDRIEEILGGLRSSTDGRTYEQIEDVLAAVTELYGAGLVRVIELAGEDNQLLERLADDDLVGSLLVLHGLHPLGLTDRVVRAIDSVRPYLGSHGGDVEVLDVDEDEGVVTLRMLGSCDGCASSSVTLELAVQKAIEEAAPEITRIDVEGGSEAEAPAESGPTPVKLGRKPESTSTPWQVVYGLRALVPGRLGPLEIEGTKLVVGRVESTLYAYRSVCPSCASALDTAALDGPVLRCGVCNAAFDVPRAGRSLDGTALHLDPLPLVEEGGEVRIAVTAQ